MSDVPMVRMGPRETRAFLFGLRIPQWLLVVVAVWAVLETVRTPGMWWAWLSLAGIVLTVAFLPLNGRTLDEYVPVIYNVITQRLTGQDVYRGGLFRYAKDSAIVEELRLPGTLAHLQLVSVSWGDTDEVGVVKDPLLGRYTAVLSVEGSTFPLESSAEQARHIQGFQQLLDQMCSPTSLLARLQILERTEPDLGKRMARDYERRGVKDGGFADANYRQILASVTDVQQAHEAYVAVSLDAAKAARDIRQAGGGDAGAAAILYRELANVAHQLSDAGVRVHGWCPPRLIGQIIRTAYDPASRNIIDHRGGGVNDDRGGDDGLPSGVGAGSAGPVRAENAWAHYRTDSGFHRSWWVSEMPRRHVPAGFLWPLLITTSCRRSVSMIFEPVTPKAARGKVSRRASEAVGDEQIRRKIGRRTTRQEQIEAADTERREDELVSGHGMPRVIIFVSTTATSLDDLETQSGDIERAAQQSSIEVVRLYGEHDQGFAAAALPLAQGLR